MSADKQVPKAASLTLNATKVNAEKGLNPSCILPQKNSATDGGRQHPKHLALS
jgi:hypothetical protein